MKHTGVTVKKIIEDFCQKLEPDYQRTEILQFVSILFEYRIGWSRAKVHAEHSHQLSGTETAAFYKDLSALAGNEPVQYIIGETEFFGSRFFVTPDVLIPRPETEELVELVILEVTRCGKSKPTLLDLGTGSGAIAITLKLALPDCRITAVDNSPAALEIARRNAARNHCKVSFLEADIFSPQTLQSCHRFDFIISNPPYVLESDKAAMRRNVLDHEPGEALFVPDQDPLLYYKAIADFAASGKQKNPLILAEINEKLGAETRELFCSRGWENVTVFKDMNRKDRFVRVSGKNIPIA